MLRVLALAFAAMGTAALLPVFSSGARRARGGFALGQAWLMVAFYFALVAVCQAGFILGLPVGRGQAPAALVAALAGHWLLFGRGRRSEGTPAVVSTGLFALSLGLALWLGGLNYDVSYDGRAYHQDAILGFLDGYNPLTMYFHGSRWVNDYPKAMWTASAALTAWMPSIQNAKAMQWVALAAAFWSLVHLLAVFGRRGLAFTLLAAVLALNPVVVSQLGSLYVDGMMASLLTVLICSAACLAKLGRRSPPALAILAALAAALEADFKFTGLVYAAFVLGSLFVFSLLQAGRPFARRSFLLGLSALGFILFLAANPYVSNVLSGNHVFHPIMGENPIPIVEPFRPPYITRSNALAGFAMSHFGRVKIIDRAEDPEWMNPFDVFTRWGEFENLRVPDARVGGFGPFMGAALLATAAAYAIVALGRRRMRRPGRAHFFFLCWLVFGSTLLMREAWWARYAPQVWLFWLPLALHIRPARAKGALKWALGAAVVIAATSSLATGTVNARYHARETARVVQGLALAHTFGDPAVYQIDCNFMNSNRRLLEEAGLPFEVTLDLPDDAPQVLLFHLDDGLVLYDRNPPDLP